jgi:hypothetical protein
VGWLVGVGLLALCAALLFMPRRALRGRSWALLRCFFPSWRFFEDIDPGPTLNYCSAAPGAAFGPWHEAVRGTAQGLLLNARGNLWLAYQSLVEQLWIEIEESSGSEPSQLISYRLVQRLVLVELLQPAERAAGARYRFRLSSGEAWLTEFVSLEHEI